jgi:hypothetical protein
MEDLHLNRGVATASDVQQRRAAATCDLLQSLEWEAVDLVAVDAALRRYAGLLGGDELVAVMEASQQLAELLGARGVRAVLRQSAAHTLVGDADADVRALAAALPVTAARELLASAAELRRLAAGVSRTAARCRAVLRAEPPGADGSGSPSVLHLAIAAQAHELAWRAVPRKLLAFLGT